MDAGRGKRLRVGATVLIASALSVQAALADSPERDMRFERVSVSRTIDISGLDLGSQEGAQRLYRRIATTAKGICLSDVGKGVVRAEHRHGQARRCFNEAVDGALAQVAERTGVDLEKAAGADRFDYANLVAWR